MSWDKILITRRRKNVRKEMQLSDVCSCMGALRYLQDVGSRAQWRSSSHHFLWQAGLPVLLPKVGLLLGIFEPSLKNCQGERHLLSHLCGRLQHGGDEQQGPLQHPELAQGRLLADESHREDPQLAGITEEVNCGTQGGLTSSIEMD